MKTSVLTADDPLYDELYDVRREAVEFGNLVEQDMNPAMSALRQRAPVQKGSLRELLGLPSHQRHVGAIGRQAYTALNFTACDSAFRNNVQFSSRISGHPSESGEETMGVLEMDGERHMAFRRTLQPMFLKPRTLTWWRQRWINDIVASLIARLKQQDRAELNLDFCARVPVHTVTRAIGMDGNNALVFRTR